MFTLTITSCVDTQDIDNVIVKNKKESVLTNELTLQIGPISFDKFYQTNKLYGARSISQAQSKVAWSKASKNKSAAWCYADSIGKKGVLYNGYALAAIEYQNNFLLPDSIYQELFEKQAQTAIFESYDSLFLVERNANGNFYSLGYHSFWVRPESDSGGFNIISVNQSNANALLSPVNPGNGYFIRLLK